MEERSVTFTESRPYLDPVVTHVSVCRKEVKDGIEFTVAVNSDEVTMNHRAAMNLRNLLDEMLGNDG